jgi:hypothetical protein
MPMAIPLIAAGVSVAGGVAAMGGVAAIAAGTMSLSAGLIGGAMIAGGAMTAIGAVTGNRNLMKYGGILALAGGAAGLATNAWGSVATSVQSEASLNLADTFAGGTAAPGLSEVAGATGGMAPISSVAGSVPDPFGIAAAPPVDPGASGFSGGATAAGPVAPAPGASTIGIGQLPPGASYPPGQGPFGGVAQGLMPAAAPAQGMLGNALQWVQKNPALAMVGANIAGSVGTAYATADAQKEQIRMKAAEDQRARDRLNNSIIGARPMPTWQPTKPKVGG